MPGPNKYICLLKKLFFKDLNVIITEHNNVSLHYRNKHKISQKISYAAQKYLYSYSNHIVCVSRGVQYSLLKYLKAVDKSKLSVIPNPIDIKYIDRKAKETFKSPVHSSRGPSLVAIGRLNEQKAYPDMVKVIHILKNRINPTLLILGEGEQRDEIQATINRLGLDENIKLAGFQDNPYKYLKSADYYLSTSHWEGFHITILEAMACGAVPVVTDCDYGPSELIQDGENGFLLPVGEPEKMADRILDLMRTDVNHVLQNARSTAENYDIKKIVHLYEKLLV